MKEYFAGGNTADGFINYLPYAAKGKSKIWIMRGCPGCGKSTFLKKLSKAAFAKGLYHELIYCSSDPSSLDGIVIPEMSFAIFDGTSPHTLEVRYPLAVEREIDLSAFCREPTGSAKAEIKELIDRKKQLYRRGYMLLSAAEMVKNSFYEKTDEYILHGKIAKYAARVSQKTLQSGDDTFMQITAFGGEGIRRLHGTLESDAKTIYYISDIGFGVRERLFEAIVSSTGGKKRILSFDAFSSKRCTDILVGDTLFTSSDIKGAKKVSAKRFLSHEAISKLGKERKQISEQYAILTEKAKVLFAAASLLHGEIEAYYTPLIDIEALNAHEAKLLAELL